MLTAAVFPLLLFGIPADAQGLGDLAPRSRSGWRAAVGVEESFYNGSQFADTSGRLGAAVRLSAEAARVIQTDRDNIALSARGSVLRFARQPQLDQNAYELSASASRVVTRRIRFSVDALARTDLIDRTLTFGSASSTDGVPLAGLLAARSSSLSAGLAYRHTPKLESSLSAGSQRFSVVGSSLSDGRFSDFSAGLSRTVGRRSRLGATLGYRRSSVGVTEFSLPQLIVVGQHRLTKRLELRGTAGSVLSGISGTSPLDRIAAGAGISVRAARSSIGLDVNRAIGQQFGIRSSAIQATNSVSANFSRRLDGGLSVDIRGAETWGDALTEGAQLVRGTDGSVGLTYAPRRGPVLTVNAFAARRRDQTVFRNSGFSAALRYQWSQLRRGA